MESNQWTDLEDFVLVRSVVHGLPVGSIARFGEEVERVILPISICFDLRADRLVLSLGVSRPVSLFER